MMPIRVPRLLGLLALALLIPAAAAAQSVTVRVVIERVRQIDDLEPGDEADFYTVTTIDGQEFETDDISNQDDVMPDWQFSVDVPLPRVLPIPIQIAIFERDGVLRGDDEHADLTTGDDDRDVDLLLSLGNGCLLSGDVSGSCDETLVTRGDSDDRGEIEFRVEVEAPPRTASGLNVQCIHRPILPDPGEPVEIIAFAVNDQLQAVFVDEVEIWVDDPDAPAFVQSGSLVNGAIYDAGSFAEGSFDYGCRVLDGGEVAFSGWRKATVGDPGDYDEAVPVLFTAPRRSAIDIVFVADQDNYAAPLDRPFVNEVFNAINNGFQGYQLFLRRQDAFNFWIAREPGDAEPGCDHDAPSVAWADAKAILHTDAFRDCAPGGQRVFSATVPPGVASSRSAEILRHETGHRPFGLADEYCDERNPPAGSVCDGGYFQNVPFPNLYSSLDGSTDPLSGEMLPGCASDAPDLGRTGSDCVSFEEDVDITERGWFVDRTWFVSEPASGDLMVDNEEPQAADERRILWLLDRCDAADC